jgi:hypothetical protein
MFNVLRRTGEEIQTPVVQGFLKPIDIEVLARKLGLEAEGKKRGALNRPESASAELDVIEQGIVRVVTEEWSWQGAELINQLRAYAQRLLGYSIRSEAARLELAARDALSKLQAANHRAVADLGPLREAFLASQQEMEGFRDRNRLIRPPRLPTGRWTTFGLLFIFIAAESVLNGFFFAKGSEFGLVGGVGTAIGISFVNVAFSFLLGLGPARWINLRNVLLKFLGVLFAVGGLALVVGLHVFAAHLRDAMASIGDERAASAAMDAALDTMARAPWRLADYTTYYLFGLGVLFALGAFWKGYRFDDPYPSYGAMARREIGAREEYSDAHSELFDDLEEIKEATVALLDHGMRTLPNYPQLAGNIRAERAALLTGFHAYEAEIEQAVNQLLGIYRDANKQSRNNSAPQYFARKWLLPHSFLRGTEVTSLIAEPPEPEPELSQVLVKLGELSQMVLKSYDSLFLKYPHPVDVKP